MKKFLSRIFSATLLFCTLSGIAQVSVNNSTGTANGMSLIYTLSSENVLVPMSLVYSAIGVKPKDMKTTAGNPLRGSGSSIVLIFDYSILNVS